MLPKSNQDNGGEEPNQNDKGLSPSTVLAIGGTITTGLAADDFTVVLIADDVLIPVVAAK